MASEEKSLNFIEQIIEEDIKNGLSQQKLRFRFPPEPNGYLHIGHASSIALNFGLGIDYQAPVNLRFDDTNPAKEEQEFVDAIKRDVQWLGYQWEHECYASDYFQQLYDWAVEFIKKGKAYVDSQTSEEMAQQKGTPSTPGVDSPYRNRSVEENLDLFERMKNGEFPEGTHILRAKIDMKSTNMLMRDPIMYRILHKHHHRTGDAWKIYPMYDWAHGESDYLEQISHSFCTLEFLPHRELYDWFLDQIYDNKSIRPKQREFARRNLSHTVVSKRKLLKLVEDKHVNGWDDPRMSTVSGLRRRGYTPASIRNFAHTIGIAKRDNLIDVSVLEFCIREDLNKTAPRVMAVLDPVKLVITNYPEGKEEWLDAENNQEDENAGFRKVPFSRELYIEREDFLEEATGKFFRLTLGKEVRLKNAYIIKGESVVKDANGNITEIHVTYDTDSLSGSGTEASQRKVSGTLHWVSIAHAIEAEVRLYDRLFTDESPDTHKGKDFLEFVNPNSLQVVTGYLEPSLKEAKNEDKFQFQRLGYFTVDKDSTDKKLVFNRTVSLKDTWEEKGKKEENIINNSLKEINKYFKVATQEERNAVEKTIGNELTNVANFSLLQNTLKKNINNNKSSLLFSNYLLKYSALKASDVETEVLHKLYSMSLKSESPYVRLEVIKNLKNDEANRLEFSSQLDELKISEKNEEVLNLLSEN
ncbi:glutamine--tRNA ligase/YqeY domain fusion protein [Flavobacterium lindanitolerans]|uniref:glutamine--tRNA ligase/YqeY domain fusion protein n=1 Tax=Flavobacterium lindanitolerans TaxID=428988 RepID=UPI0011F86AAD|nr:glutamine--tRNA ligase/YqeY domain fusion protein [Flavobacterium lindanitolerans]MDQ7959288.1 glutamine--tRNA ligase/YqeY domain fusion protein [Flavobacterium lindanitolerans]THD32837.1 MAG: glutamine--tRNA ligase/YqeY domain fusion protein [Flavobacterium johnsoniae]